MTTWCPKKPDWTNSEVLKLLPQTLNPVPPDLTLDEFIQKSNKFSVPFPVDSVRCCILKSKLDLKLLEQNINSAYPIIHENVLYLYAQFLIYKKENGTAKEKGLYQDMDLLQFIDRLLTKRAVFFYGRFNTSMILNQRKGTKDVWDTIGTDTEKEPFTLKNCLSHDEVKLSALMGVSSLTYFLNEGTRKNLAKHVTDRSQVENQGIIIGLVGAKLVKPNRMEYEEIIITDKQNQSNNGYGKQTPRSLKHVFADFYEEESLEYNDVAVLRSTQRRRFQNLSNGDIFDTVLYHKRLAITLDTLFLEANQRAKDRNTTAYIHVVGLGLGVWKKTATQDRLFMEACFDRIKQLGSSLHYVSDIRFAWIGHNTCGPYKNGDVIPISDHPKKGIKIYFNRKNPHEKLKGPDAGKLLVVSFAWDGNALPGNEFWNGKLGSTGDSSTASSTQISEIHNAHINPKVCARNVKIVSAGQVISIESFIKNIKRGIKRSHDNV